jgi:hypothetical protein
VSTIIITSPIIIAIGLAKLDTHSRTTAGNNIVGYCAVDLDSAKTWCKYCNNNTNSPSGYIPASEENTNSEENINPNNGGRVLSNDDSSNSSISKGGGIDSSKITSGAVFKN